MNGKKKKLAVILAVVMAVLMVGSVATLTITMIISALTAKAEGGEGELTYTPEPDLYEGSLKMETAADGSTAAAGVCPVLPGKGQFGSDPAFGGNGKMEAGGPDPGAGGMAAAFAECADLPQRDDSPSPGGRSH